MPTFRDGVKETPYLLQAPLICMGKWLEDPSNKVLKLLIKQRQEALAEIAAQKTEKANHFFDALINEIGSQHSVIPLATRHAMAFCVTLFVKTDPFGLKVLTAEEDPDFAQMQCHLLSELLKVPESKKFIRQQADNPLQSVAMRAVLQKVVAADYKLTTITDDSRVNDVAAELEQLLTAAVPETTLVQPESSAQTLASGTASLSPIVLSVKLPPVDAGLRLRPTQPRKSNGVLTPESLPTKPLVHDRPKVMPTTRAAKQTAIAADDDAAHFSAYVVNTNVTPLPSPMQQPLFNAPPPHPIKKPVTETPISSPNATPTPSTFVPTPFSLPPPSLTIQVPVTETPKSSAFVPTPFSLPPSLTIQVPETDTSGSSSNTTQTPSVFVPAPGASVHSRLGAPMPKEKTRDHNRDDDEQKCPSPRPNSSPLSLSQVDRLKADWLEHVLEQSAEAATHDFALDEQSIAINSESHHKALTLATLNKSQVIFKHSLEEGPINSRVQVELKGGLSLDQKITKAAQMAMVAFFSDKDDAFFLGEVAPHFTVNAASPASDANARFAKELQQLIVKYIATKRLSLGVASASKATNSEPLKLSATIASPHVPAEGVSRAASAFHNGNHAPTSTISGTHLGPHPYHLSVCESLD